MATKMKFLRKQPMKDIGARFLNRGASYAGTGGAALLSNTVLKDKQEKWHGPGFLLLDGLATAFLEDGPICAGVQGMGNYGFLKTIGEFAPATKDKLGLSGVGAEESGKEYDGKPDWAKLSANADRAGRGGEEGTAGTDDEGTDGYDDEGTDGYDDEGTDGYDDEGTDGTDDVDFD